MAHLAVDAALDDLEGEGLAFFLDDGVGETPSDDAFDVVDGVAWVGGHLRFGSDAH